jgi:hypothetical protein
MMNFKDAEEKFKQIKSQFISGILSEAEFKARLEEMMIQDEEGKWWMIGFESGQWYFNDGTSWVRSDPPGYQREGVTNEASHELKTEPPSSVPPELSRLPQVTFVHNRWRDVGFIVVGAIVSVLFLLSLVPLNFPFPYGLGFLWFIPILIFGITLQLFGLFFGPWVSGISSSIPLLLTITFSLTPGVPEVAAVVIMFFIFLPFYTSLPSLLVKDPGKWKHTAIVGGLTSLAMIGVISLVISSIDLYYFKETPEYIVACILYLLVNTFLLSLFSYHLINPVRKRGWYWRDAHPGSS